MAKKNSSGYVLTFYSNRSTPRVHKAGAKPKKPKSNWGKQTSSRRASKAEVKKMRNGKWLRTNSKGKAFNKKRGIGPSKAASKKAVRSRKRKGGSKRKKGKKR